MHKRSIVVALFCLVTSLASHAVSDSASVSGAQSENRKSENRNSEKKSSEHQDILLRIATAFQDTSQFPQKYDAEVWLARADTVLQRYEDDPLLRSRILEQVMSESSRWQLDADLLLALIEVESHFDRYAVSRVGAQGLMQVMPFWKFELGRAEDNLIDPETNIRYGAAILAHYLEKSEHDLIAALSRYNGTDELRYANKVVNAWNNRWSSDRQRRNELLQAHCARYPLQAC